MCSFVSLTCPLCRGDWLKAKHQRGILHATETVGRWRCPVCDEIFLLVTGDASFTTVLGPFKATATSDGIQLEEARW